MSDWEGFTPSAASFRLRNPDLILPQLLYVRGHNWPLKKEETDYFFNITGKYDHYDKQRAKDSTIIGERVVKIQFQDYLEKMGKGGRKKRQQESDFPEDDDQTMEVAQSVAGLALTSASIPPPPGMGMTLQQLVAETIGEPACSTDSITATAEEPSCSASPAASGNGGPACPTVNGKSMKNRTGFPATIHSDFSDIVDTSLMNNDGILVQFINTNCLDAASIIGAIRLPVRELVLFPAYLAENKAKIKLYAVDALQRHLQDCQSPVGAGETDLSVDDFSLSFTIASITDACAQLNPSGRREAGLWICQYPWLARKVDLDSLGIVNCAYVINAYVHLLDANRRRRVVLKKIREEAEQAKRKIATPAKKMMPNPSSTPAPAVYASHLQPSKPNQVNMALTRKELQAKLDAANQVIVGLATAKGSAVTNSKNGPFPQLPPPAVPGNSWPKNRLPKL